MPATYEPIATTTLSTATNSITFSSIPQTYTDLRLVWNLTGKSNTNDPGFRLNGNTGNTYSLTYLNGNGTSASSGKFTSGQATNYIYIIANVAQSQPWFYTLDIFSYTGSTYKTMLYTLSGDNNGTGGVTYHVGLYNNSSAITSITALIYPSGNQNIGTTATLYGILKA
jgi:hypothetical protein